MVISRSIKKIILLCCAFSALAIPLQSHAGFFDTLKSYFTTPTQNALVATSAAYVGLLGTTVYYFWKSHKAENELKRSDNYYAQYRKYESYLIDANLEIMRLKSAQNNRMRNFDQCSAAYQSAIESNKQRN